MEQKRKSRTAQAIRTLRELGELPRPGAPHLELNGNNELVIDGCKGVVAYGEDEIRLDLGGLTLSVTGANLTMRSLQLEECAVTGQIAALAFMN